MKQQEADITLGPGATSDPQRTPGDLGPTTEPTGAMPSRIGRFRICRPLGSGGMSVVYEAYDDRLQRSVALKLLRGPRGKRRQARLQREAQALAALSHPNVVEVYETGVHEGRAFLVMERLPGQPLQRWLAAQSRSTAEIVECFIEAGRGLAAAHAQGLVHRDFKPSNVLVDADGRVRVFDFGLAAPSGDLSEGSADSVGTGPHSLLSGPEALLSELEVGVSHEEVWETALTRTGAMLGTPAYMSPEQFEGRSATPASDQFALCIALWESLYGEHPFVERDQWEQLARHVLDGRLREPTAERKVPAALHRVLVRGLSVRASARWPGMEALLEALAEAKGGRPWRRGWVVGGASIAAAGIVAALWLTTGPEEPQTCSGAADKLAEVWGPERKAVVRDAMFDTGVAYAGDTWRTVELRLDRYATDWSAEHRDACEATERRAQSEDVMDGRMACLEHRRRELGSLVDVLADADRDVIRQALAAVSQLDPIAPCHDASAGRHRIAAPTDPQQARDVATNREILGRARALERAGKYREGLELSQPAAAAADAMSYVPLQAEAQLQVGRLHRYLGEHDDAERVLERAYFLAEEVDHDEVALDAATMLAYVIARLQQRPDDGLAWVKHTRAVAERIGDERARARYLNTEGSVLWGARRFEEALERFTEALPLYERQWGPEHPLVAGVLNNTGLLLLELRRTDSALDYIRRSLAIRETALGPMHPEVGKMLNNQGLALSSLGRDDEALDSFRRAHALRLEVLGPDHPDVAKPLANIAGILLARGKHDEAADHAAQSLAIRQRAHGEDSPEAASMEALLGLIRLEQGRPEPARARLVAATSALEQALGRDHVEMIAPLSKLAEAEWRLGRFDDALAHAERALSLARTHELGAAVEGSLHQALAAVRWDHGDRAGAWEDAEQAGDAYARLSETERERAAEVIEALHRWQQDHPPAAVGSTTAR